MIKLIHGADLHLDSPFSGLSPEQAALRRGEQRLLLGDLARLAREEEAQLVLLSGDLLDSDQVYRETARALARALGDIPCPVFIAPGNHDYHSPSSVYATLDWPDNVHIFSADAMTAVELPRLGCVVHGRAFTDAHRSDSPLAGFRADRSDGRIHLGCLHGDVNDRSSYGPITPEEIAASALDYLALGHIHQYSGLNRAGDTFWAYPGCPEGRGFDETGEKGVIVAEVEPGQVSARFVPLCRRQYRILTVDVTGRDPLTAVAQSMDGDLRGSICRILLTGEGDPPNLAALQTALAPRFFALSLQDHTRLPRDLWTRREEDTLTGLFLQIMWDQCRAEPENAALQLAARFGLAALENGEEVSP